MNQPSPQFDRTVSKVEVKGFEARHYDWLMNIVTGGSYPFFIRRAVRDMGIRPDDHILILGAGTGRNACLMTRHLGTQGRIVGLDIGPEMLAQAQQHCRHLPNVTFEARRIEEPLPYTEEFDKVFISFVLHGFVQADRVRIVDNVRRVLRPGGEFLILDYGAFESETSNALVRWIFRRVECPLAADFARRDWPEILDGLGFHNFAAQYYYWKYVRLLHAQKSPQS